MVAIHDGGPPDWLPPTPLLNPVASVEGGQGSTFLAGIYPPSYPYAQKTPRDILAKWLPHAEKTKGEKHIAQVYDYLGRFWAHLMDIPFLTITQEQVQDVHVTLEGLGWSPESFNKALNAFSCLATYAKTGLRWFPIVPFCFSRQSTQARRSRPFMRKHHVVPFLRAMAAQDNLHALMIAAIQIGLALREGEVLLACWSKFSYDEQGQLLFTTLGKNNKERKVPVPEWVEIMIRRYEEIVMDPEYRPSRRAGRPRSQSGSVPRRPPSGAGAAPQTDWMFPGRTGAPHAPGFASTYIRRACEALGIKGITPQRLRASGANVLKLDGLGIDEIMKLLGHAKITTTVLYLEQTLDAVREVQDSLGAHLWPGVPSAIQEIRLKVSADPRPRLLPPPKEVIEQVGKQLANIDTPAMRLLPPDTPVAPTAPESKPTDPDEGINLTEKIQELRLRPKPSRPTKSQLAQYVWLMPTSSLAEIYGVSDVAVGKWCAEYGIKKPGRGYWAQVHAATATLRRTEGQV